MSRQAHGDRMSRQFVPTSAPIHEHLIRRSHPELLARENDVSCKAKPRPRTLHYPLARLPEPEVTRTRPRSSYESPPAVRELKGPRNVINTRDVRISSKSPFAIISKTRIFCYFFSIFSQFYSNLYLQAVKLRKS